VVGVTDGDTITVLDSTNGQHKVRLAGIDAPEKAQPFGSRSKQSLASMVAGKTVAVEFVKFDRYQRMVGKVILNGRDICLEQIKAGMAWHYKKYGREQLSEERAAYAAAETEARSAGRGLWVDTSPMPPLGMASCSTKGRNSTVRCQSFACHPLVYRIPQSALERERLRAPPLQIWLAAPKPGRLVDHG